MPLPTVLYFMTSVRVSCPADKIAFSLAKVASDDSVVIPPAVIPVRFVDRLQGRKADRISLLCKLAAEEGCN